MRRKPARPRSAKNPTRSKAAHKGGPSAGERILEGLGQAIAWTRGKNDQVRVTPQPPAIDVRKLRTRLGLSQTEFAARFGLPPATLRNWEQGRAKPDAPTKVLLAVIAKHPEAVEDVLKSG